MVGAQFERRVELDGKKLEICAERTKMNPYLNPLARYRSQMPKFPKHDPFHSDLSAIPTIVVIVP